MEGKPIFRRAPWVLEWWMNKIRKTPNTWVTTPIGIMVPRSRWDDGSWVQYTTTIKHETIHWERCTGWAWCVDYLTSWQFRYWEECMAYQAELEQYDGPMKALKAGYIAEMLIGNYGVKLDRETIVNDLLNWD